MGVPHCLIQRTGLQKLLLRAGGFDMTLIYDDYLICIGNGLQTVGNDNYSLALYELCQCGLNDRLVFGVGV